jgi:hypothetical protein
LVGEATAARLGSGSRAAAERPWGSRHDLAPNLLSLVLGVRIYLVLEDDVLDDYAKPGQLRSGVLSWDLADRPFQKLLRICCFTSRASPGREFLA